MYGSFQAIAGLFLVSAGCLSHDPPICAPIARIERVQNNAFPFPPEGVRRDEPIPAEARAFVHPAVAQLAARWQIESDAEHNDRLYRAFDGEGRLLNLIRLDPSLMLREQFVVDYSRNIRVDRYTSAGEAALLGQRVSGNLPQGYLVRSTSYSYGNVGGRIVLNRVASSRQGNQIDYLQFTRDGGGRLLFGDGRIASSRLNFGNQLPVGEDALRRAFDLWDQFGRL